MCTVQDSVDSREEVMLMREYSAHSFCTVSNDHILYYAQYNAVQYSTVQYVVITVPRIGVLSSEHWPDLKHSIHVRGYGHLLVQLRGLG